MPFQHFLISFQQLVSVSDLRFAAQCADDDCFEQFGTSDCSCAAASAGTVTIIHDSCGIFHLLAGKTDAGNSHFLAKFFCKRIFQF